MRQARKILFIVSFVIYVIQPVFSQNLSQNSDTLRVSLTKSGSDGNEKTRTTMGSDISQSGNAGMDNGVQTAKQVRGSRPDMSKSRGARPPVIVRPSGSGIPKGAGNPGGAGRYGRR